MKVRIAFSMQGNMGSVLLRMNFVKKFASLVSRDKVDITLFGHHNMEITNAICTGLDFIDHIDNRISLKKSKYKKYDLVLKIDTFPIVLHKSIFLGIKSRLYNKIAKKIQHFAKHHDDWIRNTACFRQNIYQLAKMRGRNCVNCIDFDRFVGVPPEFIYNIPVPQDYTEILKKYGLREKKFITLNRGSYTLPGQGEGTRVWPLEYYNQLIKLLKEHYPEYKIVQLGQNEDIPKMSDTDLCLCGKTDMNELKALLFGAMLHIDGEGGMVHLRRAMCTDPSVVLFGSTDPEYFGYETNINLRSTVCPYTCCEMHDLWLHKCLMSGNEIPLCLLSLKPKTVFKHIEQYLEKGLLPEEKWNYVFHPGTRKLLEDKRFTLDRHWAMTILRHQNICGYTLEEIKLSDILYWKQTDEHGNGKIVPITEANNPMIAMIKGDADAYNSYNKLKENTKNDKFHCNERCVELISELNKTDYDVHKGIVVIDCDNILRDGWHRTSYLLNKYGPDFKIQVVKLANSYYTK